MESFVVAAWKKANKANKASCGYKRSLRLCGGPHKFAISSKKKHQKRQNNKMHTSFGHKWGCKECVDLIISRNLFLCQDLIHIMDVYTLSTA